MLQDFKPEIRLFLFVALIAVAISVGGIFLLRGLSPAPTPSPEPQAVDTSGWQTYRNEGPSLQGATEPQSEFGFKVKYPKDWVLLKDAKDWGEADSHILLMLNGPTNEALKAKIASGEYYGEGYIEDIRISYYKSIAEVPENVLNNLGATTLRDFVESNPAIDSAAEISFAGYPAFEMVRGGFSLYYTVLIDKEGKIYEIFFGNASDKASLSDVEKTILSTFRFVE